MASLQCHETCSVIILGVEDVIWNYKVIGRRYKTRLNIQIANWQGETDLWVTDQPHEHGIIIVGEPPLIDEIATSID